MVKTLYDPRVEEKGRIAGRAEGRIEGWQEGKLEGHQEGKLEGHQEGKLEVARKLLNLGADKELIMSATGLTQEELQKLQNQPF